MQRHTFKVGELALVIADFSGMHPHTVGLTVKIIEAAMWHDFTEYNRRIYAYEVVFTNGLKLKTAYSDEYAGVLCAPEELMPLEGMQGPELIEAYAQALHDAFSVPNRLLKEKR